MWDLSSLTRGWTCVPCIARWILNHWTTREVAFFLCWWTFFLLQQMGNLSIRHSPGRWWLPLCLVWISTPSLSLVNPRLVLSPSDSPIPFILVIQTTFTNQDVRQCPQQSGIDRGTYDRWCLAWQASLFFYSGNSVPFVLPNMMQGDGKQEKWM